MTDPDPEAVAVLRLLLCEGVGNAAVSRLVTEFGSARDAVDAPTGRLREVEGLYESAISAIRRGPAEDALDMELELVAQAGVCLVPWASEHYPPPLKHLDVDAPALLWIRGQYLPQDQLAVALVGSRRCSHYGRAQARRFASGLAGMGFTVVSGLARGVDSEAHRGALQAGGRTIGVLGCGLGMLESIDDPELALAVAANGALVSELPMNTPPLRGNFPPRNRIMSGLSLGVVVVEAQKRSGSLITARLAGEQGKGVFAVPGNVDSPGSRGCHALIRDGAVLVEDPRDVAEGLGPLSEPLELPGPDGESVPTASVDDARALALSERERQVFDLLGQSAQQIDAVITRTGLAASIVSSTLLTLEIRGLVKQLPGQRYVRA